MVNKSLFKKLLLVWFLFASLSSLIYSFFGVHIWIDVENDIGRSLGLAFFHIFGIVTYFLYD
jgi:hypothetical protein